MCFAWGLQVFTWNFNIFDLAQQSQGRPLQTVTMMLLEYYDLLVSRVMCTVGLLLVKVSTVLLKLPQVSSRRTVHCFPALYLPLNHRSAHGPNSMSLQAAEVATEESLTENLATFC